MDRDRNHPSSATTDHHRMRGRDRSSPRTSRAEVFGLSRFGKPGAVEDTALAIGFFTIASARPAKNVGDRALIEAIAAAASTGPVRPVAP